MYFILVFSPELFRGVYGGKSTRKAFCEATELMVTMDHDFFLEAWRSPARSIASKRPNNGQNERSW